MTLSRYTITKHCNSRQVKSTNIRVQDKHLEQRACGAGRAASCASRALSRCCASRCRASASFSVRSFRRVSTLTHTHTILRTQHRHIKNIRSTQCTIVRMNERNHSDFCYAPVRASAPTALPARAAPPRTRRRRAAVTSYLRCFLSWTGCGADVAVGAGVREMNR